MARSAVVYDMEAPSRVCPRCKVDQPRAQYTDRVWERRTVGKGGRGGWHCRPCTSIDNRFHKYKNLYGITLEDYDRMLEEQGGTCALCSRAPTATKRLMVDHDHVTMEVRGLLCAKCNSALGAFGEGTDEEGLLRALAYVRKQRS